jgi:hypothetical protein
MQVRRYAGAADDDGIALVRQAVRGVDGDVWLPGPDCDDGPRDACCVVEVGGAVAGFSWLVRWVEDDGTVVFLVTGSSSTNADPTAVSTRRGWPCDRRIVVAVLRPPSFDAAS